jgi:hypothetical protein
MEKNLCKEEILERMRSLHAQLDLLEDILKRVDYLEKHKDEEKK